MAENVLELKNLNVKFELEEDTVEAVWYQHSPGSGRDVGACWRDWCRKNDNSIVSFKTDRLLRELWNVTRWKSVGKMFWQ